MTTIAENTIDEILDYLEKSINNLAKESVKSIEIGGDFKEMENFLQTQFDIRLENLLERKNSSIHHLESGMKNKVIQRKQAILDEILNQYKS